MPDSFAHLHTHTEYSMLDGLSRLGDLVRVAAEDGQPALGITDHGNMYGVLDFYRLCRDAGIRPIIGTEAYMAAESRTDPPPRRTRADESDEDATAARPKAYYHLTVLAEDNVGYRNLIRLSSDAFLTGYRSGKPQCDWELLDRHRQGLIVTTGCLGGLVNQALIAGDDARAEQLAGRLKDIFGPDHLFVEVQDHGIPEQKATNPRLVAIARRLGLPLLATNDSHYTRRGDAAAHDALLCIQTGSLVSDERRLRFHGDDHYLKTAAEMRALFAEIPEACDSSLLIAERANVEIEFGADALPEFPVPDGFAGSTYRERAAAYLRHLALEGARERYGDPLPPHVAERLDYELRVIDDMGFPAYFLVVWDLIRHAREKGIRVGPGRGSAAGCCVAYCLRIVDLDPLAYDLLFERFLNPGRKQMPDIDMDFDERYRAEMIRYAAERYGSDHVAQIVTFSTIKARAAVRDAARVLGHEYAVGDRIAKAMPPLIMGRDTPLGACLEEIPGHEEGYKVAADVRAMYAADPDARQVIDVAKGIEGARRQDGIHAAAVVITREPLTEYLPVQRKPERDQDPADAPVVTQYEMHGVEDLGLLKMDFLGLRNLSVIERALDLVEATTGARPDIDRVPLDDEKTLSMLRAGDSMGVFQLEGAEMRNLMRSLAPTSFDDIAALVALYRPGPMAANMHKDYADRKNGRQPIAYLHPDMEEILADTYGLMIYQESVMRVAQKFAGYSLEEADNLRKAAGKKVRAIMAKEREKFVAGCDAQGYGAALGTRLFDIIEPFADYAFNKSHSYGYGYVSYQTAWLKANHPVEYLAALLTSVKDDKDKTAVYLAECRRLGIEVTVPDANLSVADFAPVPGERRIVFGMAAVRNVGEAQVERIVAARADGGPFADFYDFCSRVDAAALNKRTVESLIKAGAFDSLGHPRGGLLAAHEQIVDLAVARQREQQAGITSLFADPSGGGPLINPADAPIPDTDMTKAERLAAEKEMLGLYLSDHPLRGYEEALARRADCPISALSDPEQIDDLATRGQVRLGGVITALNRKFTKRGDQMATFTLEDLDSSVEIVVFARALAEVDEMLVPDTVVVVTGRVDRRDENRVQFMCMGVEKPTLAASADADAEFRVALPADADDATLDRLRQILADHPGAETVYLTMGATTVRLPHGSSVDSSHGLPGAVRALLGPASVGPARPAAPEAA